MWQDEVKQFVLDFLRIFTKFWSNIIYFNTSICSLKLVKSLKKKDGKNIIKQSINILHTVEWRSRTGNYPDFRMFNFFHNTVSPIRLWKFEFSFDDVPFIRLLANFYFLSVLLKQILKNRKKCTSVPIFFFLNISMKMLKPYFMPNTYTCMYSIQRILLDLCHTLIKNWGITDGWDARLSANVSITVSPQSKIRAVHAIRI